MRIVISLLSMALTCLTFGSQAADEAKLGEIVSTCAACHGSDGVSPDPQYPHLAGQHADFLERALLDYQSGERKNPIMAGQVANLSEAEIEALARYFSRQRGPLFTPAAD